ncbi:GH92 family glycosyl hydrolase [Persicobacter diffluens]|uniref:Alpha-1,2-mannosidase n=1 Tax=Persicobacter diffluens TaxID=981 RepID=A0AAN4W4X2_9BACT|nr:hypothetical protein PEDI_47120 [Persicobacter diffluens]
MKKVSNFFIFFLCTHFALAQPLELIHQVNPFIGTGGHGHTYPGATLPFGMVQLSPDTGIEGWDWSSGYHYSDASIMGFSHTHLSGTGLGDLGDVLLMPTIGEVKVVAGDKDQPDQGYRSRFSHDNENAHPGYYQVFLDDYQINAELTATLRTGVHRYTFPQSNESNIIIDLKHGIRDKATKASLEVQGSNRIVGYRKSTGWADLQSVYFVIEFSKPFEKFGTAIDDHFFWGVNNPRNGHVGTANVKGAVRFSTQKNEQITVKVGISPVSIDNAIENLNAEAKGKTFDQVKGRAERLWEDQLSKLTVTGNSDEAKIFYSAVYHSMLAPNVNSDVNGQYIGPKDQQQQVKDQPYFSTFSLWDTYRATHPLFNLVEPKASSEMINSMLMHYQQWGYLPIWSLWGQETHVMIGNHAISVIAEAFQKDIPGIDWKLAYEAVKASSSMDHYHSPFSLIDQYGYVPNDYRENVSITLEIAYNDWCVAQMAKAMGHQQDYEYFIKRSKSYENIYDHEVGFVRSKNRKGEWRENFDPEALTRIGDFTEGNAYQYSWFVPHDVKGLQSMVGGASQMETKLDALFQTERTDAGSVADVTGFIGQYAHGNEPSHHIAYLYNTVGAYDKTQRYLNQICNTMYRNAPDGLSGNEDCGQMSSWYVFSALGFYPVNPAEGLYYLGVPRFNQATVKLPNGKTFEVISDKKDADDFYVKRVSLNGKVLDRLYLTHQEVSEGGVLEFKMCKKPKKSAYKEMAMFQ